MPESNGRFVPFFQSSTKSKEARAAPSRAVVALLMAPLDETWRRDFRKATGEADYEKLREMIERAASPTRGSIVVVGDTPVNLTLLSRMLGRGYRVLPIPTGSFALCGERPSRTRAHGHQHARDGRLRGLSAALTVTKGKVKAFRRGGRVGEKVERALPTPRSSPIQDPSQRLSFSVDSEHVRA